jgi:hypothetical protein
VQVHVDTPDTLAEEFPGWHIWRSRGQGEDGKVVPKGWYATREQPLADMAHRQGLYLTVAADDPDGLRAQLEQQAGREGLR